MIRLIKDLLRSITFEREKEQEIEFYDTIKEFPMPKWKFLQKALVINGQASGDYDAIDKNIVTAISFVTQGANDQALKTLGSIRQQHKFNNKHTDTRRFILNAFRKDLITDAQMNDAEYPDWTLEQIESKIEELKKKCSLN